MWIYIFHIFLAGAEANVPDSGGAPYLFYAGSSRHTACIPRSAGRWIGVGGPRPRNVLTAAAAAHCRRLCRRLCRRHFRSVPHCFC